MTKDDVKAICRTFGQVVDRDSARNHPELLLFLTQMFYEQFPFQENELHSLARSVALVQSSLHGRTSGYGLESMVNEVLGCTIEQAIGSALVLHALAISHDGRVDAPLGEVKHAYVWDQVHVTAFEATKERLSATAIEMRAHAATLDTLGPSLQRFAFNPLHRTPILKADGLLLAPVPVLILHALTPNGLYYAGIERCGQELSNALGHVIEEYVGQQLRLIDDAEVYEEVEYRSGSATVKSADYLVILPRTVLVVESKSARLRLPDKAGSETLQDQMEKTLGKANKQIGVNISALADGLLGQPTWPDRRVGMIVTAEPFYLGNATLVGGSVGQSNVPTIVASLDDLEQLVTLPAAEVEAILDRVLGDREESTYYLGTVLRERVEDSNPILDQAWERLPFSREQ
ncbi:MAG: hypothetical protein U0R23_02795 [Candidatus Nanopelagicales bacterium]